MFKKVIFLALVDTFDFDQIGGTDSYMRRLTNSMLALGVKVEWVFYDSKIYRSEIINDVDVIKFVQFNDALKYIETADVDCMISCFLKPIDRFRLLKYRLPFKMIGFKLFSLSFFYPDTLLKRMLRKIELKTVRYDSVLCVSKRLYDFNFNVSNKSHYLPPIIPKDYFKIGYEKIIKSTRHEINSLQVLFLGRLDPRKGINEVISIIESEDLSENIKWTVSGIYIPEDEGNVAALQRLQSFECVNFNEEKRSAYSSKVEERVLSYFANNDIFIQPYRTLASTVDLPLLILEAQASGCITITTLPEILSDYLYDKSIAIGDEFLKQSVSLLNHYVSSSIDCSLTNISLQALESEYGEEAVKDKIRKIFNV